MSIPVLIGVAQVEQRAEDLSQAREPIELMIDAVRLAAEDAGSPAVLNADSVRVIRGMWPYHNPARAVAQAIGCGGAETGITPFGGNYVQSALNKSALDIQSGRHELIILTGAECGNTQAKAARAGQQLDWEELPGSPDLVMGPDMAPLHPAEKAIRLGRPIHVYPIFEIALRHHLGWGVQEHLEKVSQLWAGFSAVAAGNPHAWIREAKTAEEIRTPSAVNRPVSFPYPKFMNSNNNVDQGAALILCSQDKAKALGVPRDKWIYPWAGTDAHDHENVSNRDNLYSSPAIRLAGNRCLELAGVSADQLDHIDLYSCFPVAVQVAARELKLDWSRPLTVTGGLTWAGGPLNNYVMHSIARMVELLRAAPGEKGLITANGGHLTKHAFGVYSSAPPAKPFQHADLQEQVDALYMRDVAEDFAGRAQVEAYSVIYGAEGPEKAFVACRLDDQRRAWGVNTDADVLQAMTEEEFCGRPVQLAANVARF